MRSLPEFLLLAALMTLTPGPGTATVLRVAARDGRGAAMSAVVGNSCGVLVWGLLSALGVSSLIVASQAAYDALRVGGAVTLIVLGLRSLLRGGAPKEHSRPSRSGWRVGLVTSLANPKLAVFFVALLPQFLDRDAPVLPLAVAMAGVIVALDLAWFSALTYAVDRARTLLREHVLRRVERAMGAVMVAFGARLLTESR